MKDRLQKFMQSENLSAGKFAEMIGVQPSAISHIMSGRNKPGFDFLTGLFIQFPNLNPRWIILGEGSMNATSGNPSRKKDNELYSETQISPDLPAEVTTTIDAGSIKTTSLGRSHERSTARSKSIERIVIFYTDGSFLPYEQQ